jgi:hypothetical protein
LGSSGIQKWSKRAPRKRAHKTAYYNAPSIFFFFFWSGTHYPPPPPSRGLYYLPSLALVYEVAAGGNHMPTRPSKLGDGNLPFPPKSQPLLPSNLHAPAARPRYYSNRTEARRVASRRLRPLPPNRPPLAVCLALLCCACAVPVRAGRARRRRPVAAGCHATWPARPPRNGTVRGVAVPGRRG